jgi:hypothetical protein
MANPPSSWDAKELVRFLQAIVHGTAQGLAFSSHLLKKSPMDQLAVQNKSKTPENPGKTLQNGSFKPLNGAQKRAPVSFSTHARTFLPLPKRFATKCRF